MEIIKAILNCLFFIGMGALIFHVFLHQDAVRAWEDRQIAKGKAIYRLIKAELTAKIIHNTLRHVQTQRQRDAESKYTAAIKPGDYRLVTTARRCDAEEDMLRLLREVEFEK